MTKLADVDEQSLAQLPNRDDDVTLLWLDDYYDTPLSGIALVGQKRVRFQIIDRESWIRDHEDNEPLYWLIALTAEQLQEEEEWQALFCAHVWTGWDYTDRPRTAHPESEHPKFYEPYSRRVPPDYSSNEVIGWCSKLRRPHNPPMQRTGFARR